MKGRKPIPTNLKIARGNPGKKPLNLNEPKPEPATGEPPAWLPELARAEWFATVPDLQRLGMLTRVDVATLAAYCLAVEQMQQATKIIKAEGIMAENANGTKARHPATMMLREAQMVIRAFAVEFGFTPSARSRMKAPEPVASDPLDNFLKTA